MKKNLFRTYDFHLKNLQTEFVDVVPEQLLLPSPVEPTS